MGNRAKFRLLSDWQLGRILSGSVKGQGDGIVIPQYINCNLVGNKIGEIGCKILSAGKWPLLKEVYLGKYLLTKVGTSSGGRE